MGGSGAQWRGQGLNRGTGAAVDSRGWGEQHKTDVNQFTNGFHKLDSSWLESCQATSSEGLLASEGASPFPSRHSCRCRSFRCHFYLILRMLRTLSFLAAPRWLSLFAHSLDGEVTPTDQTVAVACLSIRHSICTELMKAFGQRSVLAS